MSRFFSGFGFQNEEVLFDFWIDKSYGTIAGFSYGAQKALQLALKEPNTTRRLLLFSPAFFNDQTDPFIRTQLLYFQKNKSAYLEAFAQNVAFPAEKKAIEPYITPNVCRDDLESLLRFRWREQDLLALQRNGVKIEVFIGMKDRIVDARKSLLFFRSVCDVWCIKDAGHALLAV